MLTFRPVGLYASAALGHAFQHVVSYRFAIALELLNTLPDDLLSETERSMRDELRQIAEAYSAWDLFQHVRFPSLHAAIKFSADSSLLRFRASNDAVSMLHDLGTAVRKNELSDFAVVDLLGNARRRIEEGKFDDATALLYRACEMLAQWRLRTGHGIDTSDVALDKAPATSRGWLKGLHRQRQQSANRPGAELSPAC